METKTSLLVDAGNTAVKWAQLGADGLTDMKSELYPETMSSQFFLELWNELKKPERVIVSCVAGDDTWLAMHSASKELWNSEAVKVSAAKEEHGLINAYENISSLGSDRWCAMIAARQQVKGAFMVVSAGTALTIDVINASGQHQGGYILPGLNLMRQSLAAQTANIKAETVKNQIPSLSLANSTVGCVEAGIHMATVSFIKSVYEKESVNGEHMHCYLSGGNAKVLAELLSCECSVIPNLVLLGLAEIALELN